MNSSPDINFSPIISSIQKVAVYETKHRLYLIGSNYKETRFRILEVDRTCVEELRIYENPKEFDNQEIRAFVNKIRYTKCLGAYGILGFVRFLEGYYVVLITKRTRCAAIGMHTIYTIKDTIMIRITDSSVPRTLHQHEARYVKMFCNIDLKSNFYFCYSYDLTRSLQHNMSGPKFVGTDVDVETEEPLPDWSKMNLIPDGMPKQKVEFAFRSVSRHRFVWNEFLLKPMQGIHHKDWLLEVITGFVSQSSINIYGRPIYVCLVARRSTKFAGTRFLKRGANRNGDVANEVETEQIVTADGNRMCSFVQMRGSIPSHWSQDTTKIVSKPPISLDLSDPYAETAAKHYERLLYHYGAPVIVFNLVKKREKRKHESILTQDMLSSIKYLNQFLPVPFKIKYIHFDMARKSRGERLIMPDLARIAESIVQATGMCLHDPHATDQSQRTRFQTGLVRVNCVDCLDRTNTAQFAIGKCVLGHQLHKLGFINAPTLQFDSDCVTMLESLYEDHGDTLALQYGGSQLVHRIKSYRKTAAWSSQGNDIMQTMSRYVSNKFSDTDKQHSINLFLGYFVPYENQTNQNLAIWDLPSDYYMHNLQVNRDEEKEKKSLVPITDWIRPIVLKKLPYSTSDSCKIVSEFIRVQSPYEEMVDCYANYYIPNRYTAFEEQIAYQIKLSSPSVRVNPNQIYSPFVPRKRETATTNPSLTGQSSTSSATGSTSSSCDENASSDDETQLGESFSPIAHAPNAQRITLSSVLRSTKEVYGFELKKPSRDNQRIYRSYVQLGRMAKREEEKVATSKVGAGGKSKQTDIESYFKPSHYKMMIPKVKSDDVAKYSNYLLIPEKYSKNMLQSNSDILFNYHNGKIKG